MNRWSELSRKLFKDFYNKDSEQTNVFADIWGAYIENLEKRLDALVWHNAVTDPPTIHQSVLVVDVPGLIRIAWLSREEGVWYGGDDWQLEYPVTHWMPLPELPKEER
jgi:hypothetical protein